MKLLFASSLALAVCAFRAQAASSYPKYGGEDCPCIGIDVSNSIKPFAAIAVHDTVSGTVGDFPPELGTSCKNWDMESNPACAGENPPAFCKERWCYVDPCNCKTETHDLSASTYLPTWKYHKKPLHFSYSTCGATADPWFEETPAPVVRHVSAKCDQVEAGVGSPTCPCVGFAGRPGHVNLIYGGKGGPYKAEIGSSCGLWEAGAYPACFGSDVPEWCHQTWCYVDICNCKGIGAAPRPTQKIAGSHIQGRPMYFSFETCGNPYLLGDGWVEQSCWTKTSRTECEAHSNLIGQQCGWSKKNECIDSNLLPLCDAPPAMVVVKDEL